MKTRVKDAEETSRRVGDELDSQRRAASMAESEKIDLMEAVATRYILKRFSICPSVCPELVLKGDMEYWSNISDVIYYKYKI